MHLERLNFELTFACDHRCRHCYNVWADESAKRSPREDYPLGRLPFEEHRALIERVIEEVDAQSVTLTGGEPLLHPQALELVEAACLQAPTVQLISNGSHFGGETVRRLADAGLHSAQLTLHGATRERHDELAGAPCFDETVRAAVDLRDAGIAVQICFVATRESRGELQGVIELASLLGASGLSYNRMAPAGGSVQLARALLPSLEQLEQDLALADRLGRQLSLPVATAMPIPPCLLRYESYPWIRFGFCSTGSSSPNVVIDPLGNVRSCNLSPVILGNLRERSMAALMKHAHLKRFARALPEVCRGCRYATSCRGGCKESALGTFGALDAPEPLLAQALVAGTEAGSEAGSEDVSA